MSDIHATNTAGLWSIYFPGKTPAQVLDEADARHEEWAALFKARRAVMASHQDCETAEDEADYWKRLAAAERALLIHAGVPEHWIDDRGHDVVPAGICRGCWQPGATDIDHCGGCEYHYHPSCFLARDIRGDLRLAAAARIGGDEGRAVEMERAALTKHVERRGMNPDHGRQGGGT
jgi:hypothetical protein